jgi:hypothetical protein
MSVSIDQFQNLIDPAVQKHFFEYLEEHDAPLTPVLKLGSQDVYNHIEQNYAGINSLSAIGEGETFPTDDFRETYQTTYTPVKYGRTIEITYETQLFERMDLVAQAPKEAAGAAARKKQEIGSGIYKNGFSTSYTSYGDSRPLFSVQHARADGLGNVSNASGSGVTFTEANVEVGILAMESALSDTGRVLNVFADTVVLPPALRKEAVIILKSTNRSGIADNDTNPYNSALHKMEGAIPNIIIWKYLGAFAGGSDTAWYLLDSNAHRIQMLEADPVKVEKDVSNGFANDIMKWKVRGMWSTGWSDFRGVWGSKGDGAPYTD